MANRRSLACPTNQPQQLILDRQAADHALELSV